MILVKDVSAHITTANDDYQEISTHQLFSENNTDDINSSEPNLSTEVVSFNVPFPYGTRHSRTQGFSNLHRGYDFGFGGGYEIVAPADGTVIFVEDSRSAQVLPTNGTCSNLNGINNWLTIQHNDNSKTSYFHIRQYSVRNNNIRVGSFVRRGQPIALIGVVGCTSAPHLHYEQISANGTKVEPQFIESPESQNNVIIYTSRNSGFSPAPANQNLVQNGDFSNGTANWLIYGTIEANVQNGMLVFRRTTDNGASLYQTLNYSAAANASFETIIWLGNGNSVTKQVGVHLRHSDDWNGAISCNFTLAPNAPLQPFIIRGRSNAAWPRMNLELHPTENTNILLDNVSVKYLPNLNPSGTECIPPVTADQNLTRNGNFNDGTNQWRIAGDISSLQVSNGSLIANHPAGGSNGWSAVYQDLNVNVPTATGFETILQLRNSSATDVQIVVGVRNRETWNSHVTCNFTLPPSSVMQTYTIRGRTSASWSQTRFELGIDTENSTVLVDNVSVRHLTNINPIVTECLTPVPPVLALSTPTGIITPTYGNPTYTWTNIGATTYELAVFRAENLVTPVYFGQNLAAVTYCSGQTCSINPVTQPSVNESARLTNGAHVVYIRAVGGTWAGPFNFSLNAPPPAPVTMGSTTGTNTLRPTFNWTLPSDASYATWFRLFLIKKSLFDAGNYTPTVDIWRSRTELCGSAISTNCTIQSGLDLQDNTNYYLYIQSYGSGGVSVGGAQYGNGWAGVEFRVDTLPDPAVPVVNVAPNQGRPTISWANDANATQYRTFAYLTPRPPLQVLAMHYPQIRERGKVG